MRERKIYLLTKHFASQRSNTGSMRKRFPDWPD